jgi:hypothetical protein
MLSLKRGDYVRLKYPEFTGWELTTDTIYKVLDIKDGKVRLLGVTSWYHADWFDKVSQPKYFIEKQKGKKCPICGRGKRIAQADLVAETSWFDPETLQIYQAKDVFDTLAEAQKAIAHE